MPIRIQAVRYIRKKYLSEGVLTAFGTFSPSSDLAGNELRAKYLDSVPAFAGTSMYLRKQVCGMAMTPTTGVGAKQYTKASAYAWVSVRGKFKYANSLWYFLAALS